MLPEKLQLSRSSSKWAVMNFPKTCLCLQGFHCLIIGLLRHCSVVIFECLCLCFSRHNTISSRFPLFQYLFVTSLRCSMLPLSQPLLRVTIYSGYFYVIILSFQGFHCFIICLL